MELIVGKGSSAIRSGIVMEMEFVEMKSDIINHGTWFTYGYDITKNICEVFGPVGYIRTAYSYASFGAVTESGDVSQPFQWSFEFYDSELDLVYYNYRHYSPSLGRFLSRDPIEEGGGMNLYAFLKNSTLYSYDFLGEIPLDTLWDLANIIYDICVGDEVALAVDTAALCIPYFPAGTTKLVKVAEVSKIEKIVCDVNKATITYKYIEHGNKHFKLGKHTIGDAWIGSTKSGPAQFKPGFTDNDAKKLIEEALVNAKAQGKITPQDLDRFIYDTGKEIGASSGKLTSKIQIYVTRQGEIHVRPKE